MKIRQKHPTRLQQIDRCIVFLSWSANSNIIFCEVPRIVIDVVYPASAQMKCHAYLAYQTAPQVLETCLVVKVLHLQLHHWKIKSKQTNWLNCKITQTKKTMLPIEAYDLKIRFKRTETNYLSRVVVIRKFG